MIFRSILMAAALSPHPIYHAFLPSSPSPITVTSDNIDLDGAGSLDFEPDAKAFHANPPAGGDGVTIPVRLWVDANGQPVSCDIGQSDLPQVAQTGCAQLMKSAKFHLFSGFSLPLRRGFIDVQFSFFKDPPHGPIGETMFAHSYPGYVNVDIFYPANDTPPEQVLHNSDGVFSISIAAADYPPIAIRYGMESRTLMLIGIGRDGKVHTCRPVGHPSVSNTAFLDNYTCTVFIRRGQFEFLPSVPNYDGLRYRTQAMTWKIPQ